MKKAKRIPTKVAPRDSVRFRPIASVHVPVIDVSGMKPADAVDAILRALRQKPTQTIFSAIAVAYESHAGIVAECGHRMLKRSGHRDPWITP